jgi:hypothetical protein
MSFPSIGLLLWGDWKEGTYCSASFEKVPGGMASWPSRHKGYGRAREYIVFEVRNLTVTRH